MKTVTSRNKIAGQFIGASILLVSDLRTGAIEVMDADVLNFKKDLATGCDTGTVQVLENLVLSVNRDSFSIGEILKINAVTVARKA